MNKILISIASKIALDFLESMAQALWDGFWQVVLESIREAEKEWIASGMGKVKKEWVVEKAISFLNKRKRLSKIQKWAISLFLKKVIDSVIEDLNRQLGKDWAGQVSNLKAYLADYIPFIN